MTSVRGVRCQIIAREEQCRRYGLARHFFFPMGPADGDVAVVAADHHLFAVLDNLTRIIKADDHGRLAPAMADGLHFLYLVGNGKQALGAGEQLPLKIRAQAIGDDGNRQDIGHIAQLINLARRQKLCLINKDAGNGLNPMLCLHLGQQIIIPVIQRGVRLQPDA